MGAIPVEKGLEALGQAIVGSQSQVMVSPMSWSSYVQTFPEEMNTVFYEDVAGEELKSRNVKKALSEQENEFLSRLQEASIEGRRELMTSFLQSEVIKVLGLILTHRLIPVRV